MAPFVISRRNLLRSLGYGALAYAAPRGRRSGLAAADASIPKRLVIFYGAHSVRTFDSDGKPSIYWVPQRVGGGTETQTGAYPLSGFTLGELHQPLDGLQSKLLYMDGIGMVANNKDPDHGGNAHEQGSTHALSGANMATSGQNRIPGGPSIDQVIADELAKRPDSAPIRSATLISANWAPDDVVDALRTTSGGQVKSYWDPATTYDALFGGFSAPKQDASAAQDAEQWSASWDLAKADYTYLQSRLDKAGKDRLDSHLSLLSGLTKRLNGAACKDIPTVNKGSYPADAFNKYYGGDSGGYDGYDVNFNLSSDLNIDLAVAALACDRTRVLTFNMRDVSEKSFGFDNAFLKKVGSLPAKIVDYHGFTHAVNSGPNVDDQYLGNKQLDGQNALQVCLEYSKKAALVEATKFASLLKKMDAVPEADGETLLDHSVVLWCGQIGYGNHDLDRLPWVLAGGAGYFKMGRHLVYDKSLNQGMGMPHNNLFVSLANAMDIPLTTFGNPDACSGVLDGLIG